MNFVIALLGRQLYVSRLPSTRVISSAVLRYAPSRWPSLLYRKLLSPQARGYMRFIAACKLAGLFYKPLTFTEFGRVWTNDRPFLRYLRRFEGHNYHSADRKYMLRSLTNLVSDLPGDTAECGVYRGASSYLICKALNRPHHAFDCLRGSPHLPPPMDSSGTPAT